MSKEPLDYVTHRPPERPGPTGWGGACVFLGFFLMMGAAGLEDAARGGNIDVVRLVLFPAPLLLAKFVPHLGGLATGLAFLAFPMYGVAVGLTRPHWRRFAALMILVAHLAMLGGALVLLRMTGRI